MQSRAGGLRRRFGLAATVFAAASLAAIPGIGAAQSDEAPALAERLDAPVRTINVLATGDILTESRVRATAAALGASNGERFDFEPMFAPVRGVVEWADVAICHVELPIGSPGQRPGYYGRSPFGGSLLLSPHELADDLRATGFGHCSTASNHSNDLGQPGITTTLDALDRAGITHVGTARSSDDNPAMTMLDVDGVEIGHLAYTRYSNTVRPVSWALSYAATPTQVANDVAKLRNDGAEIVLVSLHLSQELLTAPTARDRSFATQLVAQSDVDAVIHHGPHVVQPLEIVGGVPVFWSLGNFVSEMGEGSGRYASPRTSDGLLGALRFTENEPGVWDVAAGAVAICNDPGTRYVRAPSIDLADPSLSSLHSHLAACQARVAGAAPGAN